MGQGRRDGGVGEERDRGEVSELGSGSREGGGKVRRGGLIQDPRRVGAAETPVGALVSTLPLGKSLNLSVPQSPFLQNESVIGCLPGNSGAPGAQVMSE